MDGKTIALILSGASLAWNLLNSWLLSKAGERNREIAVRLEEFRNQVRAPIDAVLEDLEDHGITAIFLSKLPDLDGDNQASLLTLNQQASAAMSKLERKLDSADRSKFSDANDWADFYFSKEDPIFDSLNAALNEAATLPERQAALQQFSDHIRALRGSVTVKFEEQVQKLSK